VRETMARPNETEERKRGGMRTVSWADRQGWEREDTCKGQEKPRAHPEKQVEKPSRPRVDAKTMPATVVKTNIDADRSTNARSERKRDTHPSTSVLRAGNGDGMRVQASSSSTSAERGRSS